MDDSELTKLEQRLERGRRTKRTKTMAVHGKRVFQLGAVITGRSRAGRQTGKRRQP